MSKSCDRIFYGTTRLGEKGQVVIPAEAREALSIEKGEQLLVFGMGSDTIVFSKLSNLEKFATHLEKRLTDVKKLIKKTRPKSNH